ncbi:MAG: hypothetical protein MUO80_07565 [Dehalococcoidia bacterium]|nr:hypothetical protein [Dehalococcoidia bacterium]
MRCLAPTKLVELKGPGDAFPDYSAEIARRIRLNGQRLARAGVTFEHQTSDLLASDDQILDILARYGNGQARSLVLDITSMPKRYFCLLTKRLLLSPSFDNLVAVYTPAKTYTIHHLAEDPMTCDYLPGFASGLSPRADTLVLSVGYESLGMQSLLEICDVRRENVKIIMSSPSGVESVAREWRTLREIVSGDSSQLIARNLSVIPLHDVETVYKQLQTWHEDANGLSLAPFGPKTHTLAMVLFAVDNNCSLLYTQPKSYHPDYSAGNGNPWAYVLKWDGVTCFGRS